MIAGGRTRPCSPGKKRMALPVSFDHCVIHVSDWERSNAFYREVLGAEVVRRPKGFAYRFGKVQLNLHGPGLTPAEVARLPVQPGNSDLCFEWQGPIGDAVAHLESCKVHVHAGPIERFGAKGAGTSVYFRDPDGSLLEFIAYSSKG
jgi:catechol 2,3-dioxygenase-like lactoylglutathione lyase family enzyme